MEMKRAELEIKKLDIELNHIKARTDADIELKKAQFELREKRRTSARKAARYRWDRERGVVDNPDSPSCRLCANPAVRDPTVAEIRAHDIHSQASAAVSRQELPN
jgi:nitrate/TMAO reductase-like tetraheme cytochrome c subunit